MSEIVRIFHIYFVMYPHKGTVKILWPVHVQFPMQDQYIHMSRDNKIQLDQIVACLYGVSSEMFCLTANIVACCLCSYVCTNPELETAHGQATITALIQNISLGREGLEKQIYVQASVRFSQKLNIMNHPFHFSQ